MAIQPELAERYAEESKSIRNAVKSLVHADGGLTRLHWFELLPLMKKFVNDIALMHHSNFHNLSDPSGDLEETLVSFKRALRCLDRVMCVPDAHPVVSEQRKWTTLMPPQLACFVGSRRPVECPSTHVQHLRSLVPAPGAPTPAPRMNITFPNRELPPRRMRRSSSQMQTLQSSIAASDAPFTSQLAPRPVAPSGQSLPIPTDVAGTLAAISSAGMSKSVSNRKRKRVADACYECKLKKTGCGGRFKHCLKLPANTMPSTAIATEVSSPHAQHRRRAATFPNHMMICPASNGVLYQRTPSSQQPIYAAGPVSTNDCKGIIPENDDSPRVSETAFCLERAHTFHATSPTGTQTGTNIFDYAAPLSAECFDEIEFAPDFCPIGSIDAEETVSVHTPPGVVQGI